MEPYNCSFYRVNALYQMAVILLHGRSKGGKFNIISPQKALKLLLKVKQILGYSSKAKPKITRLLAIVDKTLTTRVKGFRGWNIY